MRIHSKTTFDIETFRLIEDCYYDWDGEICLCKGEAKAQMATNNALAAQQFALQQQYLQKYNDYVNQLIKGGGYLPGVREALTSNAITSVPLNYNSVARQLMTNAASRGISGGGTTPGSGLLNEGLGELYSSEANTKAKLLSDITSGGQANITGAETGVLNAGLGTGSTGSSLIGSATTAADTANQQSGLLGTILGGGLGVLGSAIGKGGILNRG